MPPVRIVGVGHVSLDHVFAVEAPPVPRLKTAAQRHFTMVGGMTANAVVAAARVGAAARIVAPVGDEADLLARFAAHFAREGVDARHLLPVAGACSSVSAVFIDASGERTIVTHRGDAPTRCGTLDPAWLADADVLLADPRCPDWSASALRWARAQGVPSVFDGDSAPRQDLLALAGLGQWAVFSAPGLAAYSELDTPGALAAALASGCRVAVVTLGADGLLWQTAAHASPRHLPAWPVAPVVDTVAAGDVFHGALAVALAEQAGDEAALRFAAEAAALKCLRPGGVLGAPHRSELQSLPRMADDRRDSAAAPR